MKQMTVDQKRDFDLIVKAVENFLILRPEIPAFTGFSIVISLFKAVEPNKENQS